MADIPALTFEDTVRTLEEKPGEARVSVTFNTKSAFYWVSAERPDVLARLRDGLQSKTRLQVRWNPATLEIVAAG